MVDFYFYFFKLRTGVMSFNTHFVKLNIDGSALGNLGKAKGFVWFVTHSYPNTHNSNLLTQTQIPISHNSNSIKPINHSHTRLAEDFHSYQFQKPTFLSLTRSHIALIALQKHYSNNRLPTCNTSLLFTPFPQNLISFSLHSLHKSLQ